MHEALRSMGPSFVIAGMLASASACSDGATTGSGGEGASATTSSGTTTAAATTSAASGNATSSTGTQAGTGGGSGQYPCKTPWFSDDLEWSNLNEAISAGPWDATEGDASISTNYAHSGTRSLRIAYAANESDAHLDLQIPGGTDHLFCRWWELRERAGDFPGAHDFDWGGEKFNRFRSNTIGTEVTGGLDYPLGWSGKGGFGQPGTQDGGVIGLFGNSAASNGADHFAYEYAMPRGEWHSFELEIALGTKGQADGSTRLFLDGSMVAEAVDLVLRPQTDALLEQIWIGGWYSNLGLDPEPSPAVRYVDDVVVCPERIGP